MVNYQIDPAGNYIISGDGNQIVTRNFTTYLEGFRPKGDPSGSAVKELVPTRAFPFPYYISGLEDVRFFREKEFVCTSLEYNLGNKPQVCYGQIVEETETKARADIVPLTIYPLGCEKNWLPFYDERSGKEGLKFIYKFDPLTIYDYSETGVLREPEIFSGIRFKEWRGSACPISFPLSLSDEKIDGWLLTVHQVYETKPRIYYHRFVWLSRDFTQIRYTPLFSFRDQTIEFNLSICLEKHYNKLEAETILLTRSYRDHSAEIDRIDRCYVEETLLDRTKSERSPA